MDDSPHTAPRGVSGDFFSKFKFKPQMPKQTTATIVKPYKHPHCDRRERYKCEVLTKAPHCRECNRILLERTRAPTTTTDNSTEVAALRQEIGEMRQEMGDLRQESGWLKSQVQLLQQLLVVNGGVVASTPMDQASRMETEETPIDELSMDSAGEYDLDDEVMPKDQPPEMPKDQPRKEKPRPKSITIRGKDSSRLSLPNGIYKPFPEDTNHYVLASALDSFQKAQQSANHMLNQKHLRFFNRAEDGYYAQGWYLHAVEDLNDTHGYAKEMPDGSWRRFDNAAKVWVDIEDTVPPVIHARY